MNFLDSPALNVPILGYSKGAFVYYGRVFWCFLEPPIPLSKDIFMTYSKGNLPFSDFNFGAAINLFKEYYVSFGTAKVVPRVKSKDSKYRGSPVSTVSISAIPGIVRIENSTK